MRKKLPLLKSSALILAFGINSLSAQMVDGHAYMIGHYVEIGVNANGHEGAPLLPSSHNRSNLTDDAPVYFGFVANPQEDDWTVYNGDFFTTGASENGFGLEFTVLGENYTFSNNAWALNEIEGEITDFSETDDVVITTWVGTVMDLELTVKYVLKKEAHYYTTSIMIDNIGDETYTDVYYYRNLDPDNNVSIGGGYVTTNTIVSQSGMDDDSSIVSATQEMPWLSEVTFNAYGDDWKCFFGGFSNRDASDMWDGIGFVTIDEEETTTTDEAIGLVHKIETLPPGRASSEWASFATSFKKGIDFSDEGTSQINENIIDFKLYPNPTNTDIINLDLTGSFSYSIADAKGSIIAEGSGNNKKVIDLSKVENGVYFITITQDGSLRTEKFIVR